QRHARAARGGFGPLAHEWIDTVNTPRYARIHAFVRFRLRRATCAFSLPARPREETIEFRAGRLPLAPTFSCYGKELVKELGRAPLKLPGRRRRADPGRSGRPCRTGAERISNLGALNGQAQQVIPCFRAG